MLEAGTASGTIHITAGGAIVDNRANEDPNVTARTAVINAGAGIGGAGDADIDTAVAFLSGGTTAGDVHLDAVADVQLQGLLAPAGAIFVNSAGHITILSGTFLESATGKVSNAPPLLRVAQQDPNAVILPGDPSQRVTGTIGGDTALGDNQELGSNLTLTVKWADGTTSVLTGLQAGDTVVWTIGPNGESTPTVTHAATASGPIHVFVERTYSLTFLAGLQVNKVEADFTVSNDSHIVLTDHTATNLNQTVPTVIVTTVSNKDFSRPPIVIQDRTVFQVADVRIQARSEVTQTLQSQFNRLQDLGFGQLATQDEGATLFLVAVGPDGQEGAPVLLSVTDLKNISGLLERLRKAQIPSGLYRLYYKEPGLPPQLVLEFRKTGSTIGDPVREPGRGANPVENQPQSQPAQPASPAGQQNPQGAMGHFQLPDARPVEAASQTAIDPPAQPSFSRAARLVRSWLRRRDANAAVQSAEAKHQPTNTDDS
jgi:hypothetical protein